jgi:protein-disulfide isomerase
VSELGSAPVPLLGDEDHVRGPASGLTLIEYSDFECPFCAALHGRLAAAGIRVVFRHFPVRSSHPRAWAAACAAEAASAQGRFWDMHDSLFADQARLEDPHLWQRAEALGLDLERFDSDRRSEPVLEHVRRDFHSGVRAGVVTTPTVFELSTGQPRRAGASRLEELLARGPAPATRG